jgi:hypothetical protein
MSRREHTVHVISNDIYIYFSQNSSCCQWPDLQCWPYCQSLLLHAVSACIFTRICLVIILSVLATMCGILLNIFYESQVIEELESPISINHLRQLCFLKVLNAYFVVWRLCDLYGSQGSCNDGNCTGSASFCLDLVTKGNSIDFIEWPTLVQMMTSNRHV